MKNKSKLAFDLLELEMEVIHKEDQIRFIGGSSGLTWEQIVDAINSGNFGLIPGGTFVNDGNSLTYFGENLREVIVTRSSVYSSSGFSSCDWTDSMTGGSGSFLLSSNFFDGGGGGSVILEAVQLNGE